MSQAYFRDLNPAQLQAVQHPPDVPLQILAGPGSGKTRVLTARIAHLIFHHHVAPQAICAVTFTNKAANEMRARLDVLVGVHDTSRIRMGTFHALCASFLRRHGRMVGLETNFTICDADESKKLIKNLLEEHSRHLKDKNIFLTEGTLGSMIAKAKARGQTADDVKSIYLRNKAKGSRRRTRVPPDDDSDGDPDEGENQTLQDANIMAVVADVYTKYEHTLRQSNSLDFDDLLLFGVRLFARHPAVGDWCQHVLVDEFQDTNTIQYKLMRRIAAASGCVTIVGDPDQSIYGWRSAEVKNFMKMQRDFPKTQQILLEQNYRSTASILSASMAIVSQDKKRVAKTLHAAHPAGTPPMLKLYLNEYEEAAFIATEIKRLVAATGGMLQWGDFVVLLRFSALSRLIESALQKEGIPNRVLGGHKFFERLEVKDLLAYLQLIDNPHFVPAFARVINVPARGIGEKTIAEILATAQPLKLSPLEVVMRIYDGTLPDIKPSVKRKLASFVPPVRMLQKLAQARTLPSDLIRNLIEGIEYEAYLRKMQKDWDSRWENVQELINFASEVETKLGDGEAAAEPEEQTWDGEWDVLEEFDRDQLDDEGFVEVSPDAVPKDKGKGRAGEGGSEKDTPLRLFLQASMLSTDMTADNKDDGKGKVTLTTCHAAKGLEWPVVFVPAVERGTFPSHRAEDIDEERRLLYVACTRAQALLYLTHANSRMFAGEAKKKDMSDFVSAALWANQSCFAREPPNLSADDRVLIAQLLGRNVPDESDVARRMAQYDSKPSAQVWNASHGFPNRPAAHPPPGLNIPAPFQGPVQFSSARTALSDKPLSSGGLSTPKALPLPPLSPIRNTVVNTAYNHLPTAPRHPVVPEKAKRASDTTSQHASHRPTVVKPSLTRSPLHAKPVPTETSQSASPPQSLPATLPSSGSDEYRSSTVKPACGKRRLGMGRMAGGYANKKFKTPGGGDDL